MTQHVPTTSPASPLSRRGLLAAGAGSALLTLAACRSAAQDSGSDADSATPQRGGTLTIAQTADFTPSLLFTQSTVNTPRGLVYNTLTHYDDELNPQPELAESWDVSEDGTSVTLRLREDVTFHSGRAFTADDVVFNIKNLQDPERSAQLRSTAAAITGFDVRGDHELVLTLEHPVSNLFDLFEFMIIADEETVDQALTGDSLIGTGPFTFTEWRPGSSLSFTRNENYWKSGRPYLDAVEARVITDSDSLVNSLRTGQSQLSFGVTGRDAATLKDDSQFAISTYGTGSGAAYLGVTVTEDHVSDKRVRQALAWAIDRERIVDQAQGGYGLASAAPWPKSSPAYSEDHRTHYTHDPERARDLLAEAGAENLSFTLGHTTVPAVQAIAEMIQSDLKEVGITVELEPYDSANAQERLISGEMPALWTLQHGFAQATPSTLATSAYPFNEASNTSHFHSGEYTSLVQDAWNRTDALDDEALDLYDQISGLLLDEAFVIDLVVLASLQVARGNVHGVSLGRFASPLLDDAYLT